MEKPAMDLKLVRLGEIELTDIMALHNAPRVLRHLPLASEVFDELACKRWRESKEAQWDTYGYGPWGILIDSVFAGWGGLQYEMGDADLALVLSPEYWGYGKTIARKIIKIAFDELKLESITALLPPSRGRADGLLRFGFVADGQVAISGSLFNRYRLWAAHQSV